MEYWIVYDKATGNEQWRAGPGSAAMQQLADGLDLVVVPQSVIQAPADELLATVRSASAEGVDAQAEKVRQRYLTPGAGQAMTYVRKETEARAYTADDTVETPFLTAEAAARGMTVAALAAEVIALADAWTRIGSAIEGLRMGAKAAIAAAETLGGVVAAARVDWSALPA